MLLTWTCWIVSELRRLNMYVARLTSEQTYLDDVIKWKHFPCYWPFLIGIHRSPVDSPHKGQWRGVFMYSLICDWTRGWVNNRDTGDLRRHGTHCDVTVVMDYKCHAWNSMTIINIEPPYVVHCSYEYIHMYIHICIYMQVRITVPSQLSFVWCTQASVVSDISRWTHLSCDIIYITVAYAPNMISVTEYRYNLRDHVVNWQIYLETVLYIYRKRCHWKC